MDDLMAFLQARYNEETAEAGKLREDKPFDEDFGLDPWKVRWEETGEWNGYPYLRIAKARVLREVEAKRRLLDDHHRSGQTCPRCSLGTEDGQIVFERDPCQTVRLLAAVYADHPDYLPAWSPTA